MTDIKEYHLHADQPGRLHFELNEALTYVSRHQEHCYIPHRHSFYQLIWFKEAGTHYVDYEAIRHPKNAIFFINRNQVHHFHHTSQNEGYLFHFNDFFIHKQESNTDLWLKYKLFNEIGKAYVVARDEELETISQLATYLHSEMERQQYNYEQQIYYFFRTILLKVERLKHQQHPDYEATDMYLKKVLEFKVLIESHLSQNLSVEAFASKIGVSAKTLTNYTRKYFGTTPAQIIQKRKLLEAKRLLSNRQRSIQEVAYSLGFEQPTYFTKAFKKDTGLTPKQFVKEISH